jgi:hypothetical protein
VAGHVLACFALLAGRRVTIQVACTLNNKRPHPAALQKQAAAESNQDGVFSFLKY